MRTTLLFCISLSCVSPCVFSFNALLLFYLGVSECSPTTNINTVNSVTVKKPDIEVEAH